MGCCLQGNHFLGNCLAVYIHGIEEYARANYRLLYVKADGAGCIFNTLHKHRLAEYIGYC